MQSWVAEAGWQARLFAAAGAELAEPALVSLAERTEGWAAGLRPAVLSPAPQLASWRTDHWIPAERYLSLAERRTPSVPDNRHRQAPLLLASSGCW